MCMLGSRNCIFFTISLLQDTEELAALKRQTLDPGEGNPDAGDDGKPLEDMAA